MWKRSSVALCIALTVMSVYVGAGTWAYYSCESFLIDFSSETLEPVISGLSPGETVHIVIKIPNSYGRAVSAWISLKNVVCIENDIVEPEQEWYDHYGYDEKNNIDSVITFGLWIDWDGNPDSCSDSDIWIEGNLHVSDIKEEAISIGEIPAGSSIVVVSSYHMDEETGNWAQSDTMTFDIEITRTEVEPEPESSFAGSPNEKPVADAGPDQTVYVDEAVNFDGSGSDDPDGWIMSWSWSFGDGEKDSGETVSHTYSEPGVYTVTLTVKDSRSAEVSDTCTVTVTEETEPEPLIIPPLPPILSNLIITPSEIELGEEVMISFYIENMDSQPITNIAAMNYEIHIPWNAWTELVFIELEAYEAEKVSRTITPDAIGEYTVTVDGLTGSFTVKSPPTPLRPAEFIISDFTVSPDEVLEGEAVTVSVTVTNIGEMTGTHTLEIMIDGDRPEGPPIEIVLDGGASTTITIMVLEAPGEHTVEVDGLTEGFTVTAPPGFVLSPGYVAGILILIIAGGASFYLLYRRGTSLYP